MASNDLKPLPDLSELTIAQFWSKVEILGPDDCWPWKGYCLPNGYGQFKFGTRNLYAHRVALFLTTGIDPFPLLACHSCDTRYPFGDLTNRRCCNGEHLWAGSHGDNLRDMAAKGRNRNCAMVHPELLPRGDRNTSRSHPENLPHGLDHTRPMAKFSIEQVRDIRLVYEAGDISQKELAKRLNVTPSAICRIVNRKRAAFA